MSNQNDIGSGKEEAWKRLAKATDGDEVANEIKAAMRSAYGDPIPINKLEFVESALAEEFEKYHKKLHWLFWEYNNQLYSLEHSKALIVEALQKASKKYGDSIPLLYTTQIAPSPMSMNIYIGKRMQTEKSFKGEDYGRINIVEAIKELLDEGIISSVVTFRFLDAWAKYFTVEVYLAVNTDKLLSSGSSLKSNSLDVIKLEPDSYDPSSGILLIAGEKIRISLQKNRTGSKIGETREARLMRLLFNDVNTMRNGVPMRKIVNVNRGEFNPNNAKLVKNYASGINKKVSDKVDVARLINWNKDKVYIDSRYL